MTVDRVRKYRIQKGRVKAKVKPDKVTIIVNQAAGAWSSPDVTERGDLYAVVTYGNQKQITSMIPKWTTLCPTWNQVFEFDLQVGIDSIEVQVCEKFVFSSTFRGKVRLELKKFKKVDVMYSNSYRLYDKKGKCNTLKVSGCVGLQVIVWKFHVGKEVIPIVEPPTPPKRKIKVRKFNLTKVLQSTPCSQYATKLFEMGYGDSGAFGLLTNALLKKEIGVHDPTHRDVLLALAFREKQWIVTAAARRPSSHATPKQYAFSIDGEAFYPTMQILEKGIKEKEKSLKIVPESFEILHERRRLSEKEALKQGTDDDDITLLKFHSGAVHDCIQSKWNPRYDVVLATLNVPLPLRDDEGIENEEPLTVVRPSHEKLHRLRTIAALSDDARLQLFIASCSTSSVNKQFSTVELLPFMQTGDIANSFIAAAIHCRMQTLPLLVHSASIPTLHKACLGAASHNHIAVLKFLLPLCPRPTSSKIAVQVMIVALLKQHRRLLLYLSDFLDKNTIDEARRIYDLRKQTSSIGKNVCVEKEEMHC